MVIGWRKTPLIRSLLDLGLTLPIRYEVVIFSRVFGAGSARLLRHRYSADNKCRISFFLEIQREPHKVLAVVRPLNPTRAIVKGWRKHLQSLARLAVSRARFPGMEGPLANLSLFGIPLKPPRLQ